LFVLNHLQTDHMHVVLSDTVTRTVCQIPMQLAVSATPFTSSQLQSSITLEAEINKQFQLLFAKT